ncbi:pollen-specific leucine-rich repeat extensin-like protein 3 [Rosa chinensis]|uniref:pollen-specific leucine-rich repeat extensin-like protein 3 n=1 Tax=Rosa chinensis TaxID=74649 RepID=UPI000D08E6F9|nr:pollen-specific leucine-rich repeat extensin-like protein 3 [Rosa chinensis]
MPHQHNVPRLFSSPTWASSSPCPQRFTSPSIAAPFAGVHYVADPHWYPDTGATHHMTAMPVNNPQSYGGPHNVQLPGPLEFKLLTCTSPLSASPDSISISSSSRPTDPSPRSQPNAQRSQSGQHSPLVSLASDPQSGLADLQLSHAAEVPSSPLFSPTSVPSYTSDQESPPSAAHAPQSLPGSPAPPSPPVSGAPQSPSGSPAPQSPQAPVLQYSRRRTHHQPAPVPEPPAQSTITDPSAVADPPTQVDAPSAVTDPPTQVDAPSAVAAPLPAPPPIPPAAPPVPPPVHPMTTRLRDGTITEKVRTDGTVKYPLPRALLTALDSTEPTCYTEASK